MSRRKRLLFALLPLLGGLLLAELVARQFARPWGPPRPALHYLQPSADPELLWELRPIPAGPHATNELGFRDDPGRDAELRVVVLGDSLTYGDGEPDRARVYPRLLEDALRARVAPRSLEVLSLAVPGYWTGQERRLLEARGLSLDPDLVLLQFCLNDVYEPPLHLASGGFGRDFFGIDTGRAVGGLQGFVIERSRAAEALFRWLQTRGRQRSAYTAQGLCADPLPPELEEAWGRVEDELRRIVALTRAAGVPLRVAVFPYEFQLADPAGLRAPQARLAALCRAEGVVCLDLLEPFARARAAGPEPLFFDGIHLAPAGQRVAARALEEPVFEALPRPPG